MKNDSDKQWPLHRPRTGLATPPLLSRTHAPSHPVELAEQRSKASDPLLLPSLTVSNQILSTTVPTHIHRSSRNPCTPTTRTREAGARHQHVEEHDTSQSRSCIKQEKPNPSHGPGRPAASSASLLKLSSSSSPSPSSLSSSPSSSSSSYTTSSPSSSSPSQQYPFCVPSTPRRGPKPIPLLPPAPPPRAHQLSGGKDLHSLLPRLEDEAAGASQGLDGGSSRREGGREEGREGGRRGKEGGKIFFGAPGGSGLASSSVLLPIDRQVVDKLARLPPSLPPSSPFSPPSPQSDDPSEHDVVHSSSDEDEDHDLVRLTGQLHIP